MLFIAVLLVSSSKGLPLNEFFPFGTDKGDSQMRLNETTSEGSFHLSSAFPYFDINHDQIWILSNGLFSFLPPISFSSRQIISSLRNASIVAGFWHADSPDLGNETSNEVYYQIYNRSSPSNSTSIVFDKTKNYVRQFYPGQRVFEPTVIITGTWYYISYETNETSQLNNTFQIVLSSDGERSFVFFLYHDLQWASASNETSSFAQAGFAHSEQNASETLPYSGTADIVRLMNESNVNVPGLFVFRVDTDTINAGGCAEDTSTVSLRPRHGSLFGSTAVNIYGPCFTNQTTIKCRFGSSADVDGFVVDEYRAVCLTPFVSGHGRVPVHVSINNGRTNFSVSSFTYNPLSFNSDEVTIQTRDEDNFLNVGQYINLTWQFPEMLRKSFANDTRIDIQLWNVSLDQNSKLEKHRQAVVLRSNLTLTESARIQLPISISNIPTCFIQVTAHSASKTYVGLNTGLLIVRNSLAVVSGLCRTWARQQREPSTWNSDGLLQCPMTRWQALAGGFCCYGRDQQCYKDSLNPRNCRLHQARSGHDEPSAVECYVSHATNRYGAGAECCYDSTTMLITRGRGAGTDDRHHPTRSPVEHFFHDTLPYFQCCFMSNESDACNQYMTYRPPRRGSNTMGDSGRMWGDPHYGTLDGTTYTFNGYGEYTYLAVLNSGVSSPPTTFNATQQSFVFIAQVRTVPLASSSVTVTKGFAARSYEANAEPVSVTASRRERLILRRGAETLEFEDNINTFYFPEMTISRLDGNSHSNFSLSWAVGVTIEISVIRMTAPSEQLVLNIAASVARTYRNRTYGLLGNYDGVAENDLRNQNGSVIASNASLEVVHNQFGSSWSIEPSTSLFYYEGGQSAQFFRNKSKEFIPSFVDPTNFAPNNSPIRSICNITLNSTSATWTAAQRTCFYDMSITNNRDFARASLNAGNEFLALRMNNRNVPLFNTSLPLKMLLNASNLVLLKISASSEDEGHTVQLSALHLPKNGVFNPSNGVFNWTALEGEDYLRIQARDTTNNLTSKHDIAFRVTAVLPTTTARNNVTEVPILVTPQNSAINVHTRAIGFYLAMTGIFMFLRWDENLTRLIPL